MNLSELDPGERFTVAKVRVAGEMGRRLADMGFTEGSAGRMVREGILRGPMQVRLGGYDILIRRAEAACIEITPHKGPGSAACIEITPHKGPGSAACIEITPHKGPGSVAAEAAPETVSR